MTMGTDFFVIKSCPIHQQYKTIFVKRDIFRKNVSFLLNRL